jgi:hypothetical protein
MAGMVARARKAVADPGRHAVHPAEATHEVDRGRDVT